MLITWLARQSCWSRHQKLCDLRKAMDKRIAFFEEMGCRATDHALEYVFCREADEKTIDAIMAKL